MKTAHLNMELLFLIGNIVRICVNTDQISFVTLVIKIYKIVETHCTVIEKVTRLQGYHNFHLDLYVIFAILSSMKLRGKLFLFI